MFPVKERFIKTTIKRWSILFHIIRVRWTGEINKTDGLQVKLTFFQRSGAEVVGRYRREKEEGLKQKGEKGEGRKNEGGEAGGGIVKKEKEGREEGKQDEGGARLTETESQSVSSPPLHSTVCS